MRRLRSCPCGNDGRQEPSSRCSGGSVRMSHRVRMARSSRQCYRERRDLDDRYAPLSGRRPSRPACRCRDRRPASGRSPAAAWNPSPTRPAGRWTPGRTLPAGRASRCWAPRSHDDFGGRNSQLIAWIATESVRAVRTISASSWAKSTRPSRPLPSSASISCPEASAGSGASSARWRC